MAEIEGQNAEGANRWHGHPLLAGATGVAVFLGPIAASIAFAAVLASLLPSPNGNFWLAAWWAVMLVVPTIVLLLVQRLARRALPLATLLKMTLLFPDRAPTRMSVARKAGSTRSLERQVRETRARGLADEPSIAAEHILALATALNVHDRLTRGHSERVRVLTDRIADALKLLTPDRDRLRWAALLHDIGKLGVDPEILNKPGKPTDREWEALKLHPLEGARLAQPLAPWLGDWGKTIAEHHEKYDGSGYPYGLAAMDISHGGRIVAVADSYDTMIAFRTYKRTMTTESARAELAACAGTHFDPDVVRAFLGSSARRYSLLSGPLSWLGQQPAINSLSRVGQLGAVVARTALGVVAIVGVATVAHVHPTASHAAVVALVAAPPQKSTRKPAGPLAAPAPTTPPNSVPGPFIGLGPAPGPTVLLPLTIPLTPPAIVPAPGPGPVTPAILTAAPAAPTGVSGVAGDSQVVVSWSAPASNGGSAITSYAITPFIGGTAEAALVFASSLTTQTVAGLSNGTVYTFTVTAANVVGPGLASAPSGPARPATIPEAPTGVSTVAGSGQVTLSWSAPASDGGAPVLSYTVTPFIGGVAQTVQLFVSAATSQTVTGLVNGTAYTFTVTAANVIGGGVASAPSAAVTPATVPGAPTGVSAVPGNSQVVVSWSAPASDGGSVVSSYTVTPFIGGVAQTVQLFVSAATSQTVTGLANGVPYTFTVTAANVIGGGVASAPSAAVTPATVPGAPTGVSAVPGNSQVVVSWSAPASDGGSVVSSYTVTPFIGGVAQTAQVFVSAATTETVTGLVNGTAYTFTVKAGSAVGVGVASVPSAAVTPATVPGAPTGVVGVPGDSEVVVSWSAPASDGGSVVSSYTVTPFIGGAAQTAQVFVSAATTETVTGLVNGTAYTFTVKAGSAVGVGVASVPSAAVTPATVPGAPTGVAGVAGNSQVVVSWSAPASDGGSVVSSYTVTPFIGGVAQTVQLFVSAATSQIVTGLVNGTAYTFTVKAGNAVGVGVASVPSAAVTPATVPGAPTGVSAVAGDAVAVLSWSAPASDGGSVVSSYTVTPFIGGAAQTAQLFVSAATSQIVTGLVNGTAYTFTVKAGNAVGVGVASVPSAAVTPAAVPGAPTGVSAMPGDAVAVVSWSAPASDGGSAISSYTVTPLVAGLAQAPQTFFSAATTETVTGLANGTAYTFTVTATNAAGPGLVSAPSSSVTPATVPGAPTGIAGMAGNSHVVVSWSAPASDGGSVVTSYTVTPFDAGVAQTAQVFLSAATTDTVIGLANGTAYTFTVTAANVVGAGLASAPSSPVTPATVPGAPMGVSAVAGNAVAVVSWSAPASDGGSVVSSYTVTPFIGVLAQTPQVFVSAATSQTVTGLSDGTAYTFKVSATNAAGAGPPSAPSAAVTPLASSLIIRNGSGVAGRPDPGDQIIVTYSSPPDPAAFCSSWTAAVHPDLTGPGVVVSGNHGGSGNDTIASVADAADCAGGFHFGSIDLGQNGYFNGNVTTFGGLSFLQCDFIFSVGCSTIHWDGSNTLTITLGVASNGTPTQPGPSVAIYTPDPAVGLLPISSTSSKQF